MVLSTCMLLAIMSFTNEDPEPSKSWVFSNRPEALNWLTIQTGLKSLLIQVEPYLQNSMWLPVFLDADDEVGTFANDQPGPAGLPKAFVELCEIGDATTVHNNTYHLPLCCLAPLLQIEPGLAAFVKLITFMGRLTPAFKQLLLDKDARALLILSYWFALMCRVDLWWIHRRVKSECIAICMVLQGHPDHRIRHLLQFPAQACGYKMGYAVSADECQESPP